VTLILDAAPLVALADRNDELFKRVEDLLANERGGLIVPAPVAAEVDYLLDKRFGREARRGFLRDVSAGRFSVECLDILEYQLVQRLDDIYADLNVGLADLSVVVLAHFDQRHFRTLRPVGGGAFTLHPIDG